MKRSRKVVLAITGSVVLAGCDPNPPVEIREASNASFEREAPNPDFEREAVVPDLDRELQTIAALAGQIGLSNAAALTNVTAFTNALASTNVDTLRAAGAVADTLAVRATNRANVTLITNQLMLSQTNPVTAGGPGTTHVVRNSPASFWWWHPWFWRPGYPYAPGAGVVSRSGSPYRSTPARSFSSTPSRSSSSTRSPGISTSSRGGFGSSAASHSSSAS